MADSISDPNQHASRLRHHLGRVRHHHAHIDAAAHEQAAAHYAANAKPPESSGPAGPNQEAPNVSN